MSAGVDWQAVIAATIVATGGLWWFRLVLKDVRRMAPATRYGVYALVWLAYFVVTMLAIGRLAGGQ